MNQPEELEVAVRAWAPPRVKRNSARRNRTFTDLGPSEWTLVYDTETTTGVEQRLRVGGYEVRKEGVLVERGLFYEPAAVLSATELRTIEALAEARDLIVRTRAGFVEEVFFRVAWDLRGVVIGFNLPFDISRIAVDHAVSRPRDPSMRGGFSFELSKDPFRPNVQVKRINSRAALKRLTTPKGRHPEQRNRERGGNVANHNGYFIDVATLAAALLSFKGSLGQLADLLKTDHRKADHEGHGEEITLDYLDYLLGDVLVTWECYEALKHRYDSLGLTQTPINRILSEASIGKAYLKEMGIRPPLATSSRITSRPPSSRVTTGGARRRA